MEQRTQTVNRGYAPAIITLLVGAPLIAEVLPGATRLSALFVFPIEVCVWGIGALFIRHAVRKWGLGWRHMLMMAVALSLAEELVIQQTSTAPLIVKIKGETYARAFEINYLYLIWALIYESVLVVFVPIYLVELLFPGIRTATWFGWKGAVMFAILFLLGCFAAWFSWTQVARTEVFHAEPYTPPLHITISALVLIGTLVFTAIGPWRQKFSGPVKALAPPRPVWLSIIGALWSVLLYGVLVLAFGIAPAFPVSVAVALGLMLSALAIFLTPRWAASPEWHASHTMLLICGVIVGAMAVSFIGFIVSTWWDLTFKIVTNVAAVILLIYLNKKLQKRLSGG